MADHTIRMNGRMIAELDDLYLLRRLIRANCPDTLTDYQVSKNLSDILKIVEQNTRDTHVFLAELPRDRIAFVARVLPGHTVEQMAATVLRADDAGKLTHGALNSVN